MNIEILYILFPIVYAIHAIEETFTQKRWMKRHADDVSAKFPFTRCLVNMQKSLGNTGFCLIAFEELLVILIATVAFVYGEMWLLLALVYGFSIHSLLHIGKAVALRSYVPGVVSVVAFLPYSAATVGNLTVRFGAGYNIGLCLGGTAIVAANLMLLHTMWRAIHRLK